MSDEEPTYGLLMPFVVVASNGGPYEDDAYVAGYEAGELVWRLMGTSPKQLTVHTANVPQLDLIAMRHGWTMTTEDAGYEGWTFATLTKKPVDA